VILPPRCPAVLPRRRGDLFPEGLGTARPACARPWPKCRSGLTPGKAAESVLGPTEAGPIRPPPFPGEGPRRVELSSPPVRAVLPFPYARAGMPEWIDV
jgi:hypothetical protein